MKSLFDFIATTFAFLIVLPLLLLIALLIKLTMPGPAFFRQTRIGFGGKPFTILKFRTMKVNKSSISITLRQDERITPVGRMLRKTKLDELPQLINILRGEMSIVGPRPDVPGYSDMLTGEDQLIWALRPGLSGLDSISYPFEEDLLAEKADPESFYDHVLWPDKVRINVWYAKNRTFLLDMKIILNTITLLLFKRCILKIEIK